MQANDNKVELLQAIAVCAALTKTQLPEAAARAMADELSQYPHEQVIGALKRCQREVRNGITLADVIERMDDGRPGPQEAWAIVAPCLHNEGPTVVWTGEMAHAFGVATSCQDAVGARMAFIESYKAMCQQARDAGLPVRWTQCLGTDKHGRDGPILAAVAAGRLTSEHAAQFLIGETAKSDLMRLSKPAKIHAELLK